MGLPAGKRSQSTEFEQPLPTLFPLLPGKL